MSYDLSSLYDFLLHTPEQGLRKMIVDQKTVTDVHFNLLVKIVRGCNQADFASHFEKKEYPKIKMGPAETKIKEKFWQDVETVLKSRGLLNPAPTTKAA